MHPMTSLLIALALLTTALSSQPTTPAPPTPSYTRNGFDQRMLDTSVPKSERIKRFAHIIALANHGQVRAQDLAGTLYWQGPKVDGSPVPVNLKQARVLLANAAVHGDRLAMVKLAELELAAGRETQAMVWAQLYARYLHPADGPRSAKYNGFAASLIGRIMKAGGKTDQTVRAAVASMVNHFDASILKGIDTFRYQRNHGRIFLVQRPRGIAYDSPKLVNMSGVAEYVVGFDTHGKPVGTWPLDAFPDPALSAGLRSYLTHVYANVAKHGSGIRYLRVSIVHQPHKFHELHLTH